MADSKKPTKGAGKGKSGTEKKSKGKKKGGKKDKEDEVGVAED